MEILNSYLLDWGSNDSNWLLFFLFISFLIGIFGAYLFWGLQLDLAKNQAAEQRELANQLSKIVEQQKEEVLRYSKEIESIAKKSKAWEKEIGNLQDKLRELQDKLAIALSKTLLQASQADKKAGAKQSDESAADNLKKIAGISTKIEALLHSAGILSYRQLSETGTDRLQEILETGGKNLQKYNPASWALQAALAHEGNWDELSALQSRLKQDKL